MTTPVAPVGEYAPGGVTGAMCGLGHGVHSPPNGSTVVYHSGSNPGYVASMIIDVEQGDGLVVPANGDAAVPALVRIVDEWVEAVGVSLPPLYRPGSLDPDRVPGRFLHTRT